MSASTSGKKQLEERFLRDSDLIKLQAGSGLVFGSFLALHLLDTMSANFGPEVYNTLLSNFRKYYQNPVIEIAVICAAVVHAVSSMTRYFRRRRKQKEQAESGKQTTVPVSTTLSLHRYAGYFLVGVVLPHAAAGRFVPGLWFGVHADFTFLSYALFNWPYVFYPYYAVLGSLGLYHISYGALTALRVFDVKIPQPKKKPFLISMGIGAGIIVSALFAFGGLYFDFPTPRFAEFNDVTHRILSAAGL